MPKYKLTKVQFYAAEPIGPWTVDNPHTAFAVMQAELAKVDQDREHFWVLSLNARAKIIGVHLIGTGTASACLVHPREVFRAAIAVGAYSVICAHNHPSGDTLPSDEDRLLATRLTAAGELLGIPVLDQLVIAHTGGCRSIVAS